MKFSSCVIRKLGEKDLERVLEISRQSLSERYDMSTFREVLSLSDGLSFTVQNVFGKILGFIIGVMPAQQSGRILVLAVEPGHRGKGLGTKLLTTCMTEMRKRGAKRVYLEVMVQGTRAINFYHKLGFVVFEVLPNFYSDGSNAYRMEKRWDNFLNPLLI
jgi:ribosomal-protein-alanine acetyltransferase